MNYRMIFKAIGRILCVEAALMVIPALMSVINGDSAQLGFIITIAVLALAGLTMFFIKAENKVIYAREGFIIVALSWLLMSMAGALPFVISGEIPNYIDALFEVVSGFTTTGSTILSNIEVMPKSLLFWRSFTHWIGGMGVLVFVLAIIPKSDAQSIHVMRAEVPGMKVGKLVAKTMVTARILYGIYIAMTFVEIVLLCFGGMPVFDSIVNSFSTAGTGGFGILNSSIAGYNSLYSEIVIMVFMLLFGINFNLYYFLLVKQFKQVFKSEEFRYYIGIVMVSTILIAINITSLYNNFAEALRYSSFQVSSIITTTGFATADYTKWPVFSQILVMMLMMCGACGGSTGGGFKVSRTIILFKAGYREIRQVLNPRAIITVNIDKKPTEEALIKGVGAYFMVYVVVGIASSVLMTIVNTDFSMGENISGVITCLNNTGPGLGRIGPAGNFSEFSLLSKVILSFNMLVGRLEIYPVLLLFIPSTWKRI